MQSTLLHRFIGFFGIILGLILIFFAVNIIRFSPSQWLAINLPDDIATQMEANVQSRAFGTKLTWEGLNVEWAANYFSADLLEVDFNLMSVAIGKPNLQQVTLESPYLEIDSTDLNLQNLRIPVQMGFQNLDLSNGLLVAGTTEIQDIELSMLKNGVFGEYAAQLSAALVTPELLARLGLSTLIGIDGENNLVLGKNQFDITTELQEWQGRVAGKVKSVYITPADDLTLKFVNWSSHWEHQSDNQLFPLDWAGGMTQGSLQQGEWTFSTIDTAIGYLDTQQNSHTFALQSNETRYRDGDLIGQLGLSLLTEFNDPAPWQSYNLVMSGIMEEGKSILEWTEPDIRLSMIDQQGIQQTHYLKTRQASLLNQENIWQLDDGEWRLVKENQQLGDFGFSVVEGQWPELTISNSAALSERLQPSLNLLANDVRYLDALFKQLVQ